MKIKVLASALLLLSITASAQSIFRKTYSVTAISGVVGTSDGGLILSTTEVSSTNPGNAGLVKTDHAGTVEWSRSYGDGVKAEASKKAIPVAGGYLLAADGAPYVMLVKTNTVGTMTWSKHYQFVSGSGSAQSVNDMVELADSSVVMVGSAMSGTGLLVKIDKNGNVVWNNSQQTGGTGVVLTKIMALSGGEFLVTGSFNGVFYVCRVNSLGNIIWAKTYGIMGTIAKNMYQTFDGNVVVAGSNGTTGATMMKMDLSGAVIWAKTIATGNNSTGFMSINQASNGDLVLATFLVNNNTLVFKTDPAGNNPVANRFASFTPVGSNTLQVMADGGFIFGSGPSLVRTNPLANMCVSISTGISTTSIAPVSTNVSPTFNTYSGLQTQTIYSFAAKTTHTTPCGGLCNTSDNMSASFNAPDTVCQGEAVPLIFGGSGTFAAFTWTDNNVGFGSALNPVRSFTQPGTFKITLKAFTGVCIDSTTKNITVRGDCGTKGVINDLFQKTYTNLTNIADVKRTADNGFIITGTSNMGGSNDVCMVKTDSVGAVQWGRAYGGPATSDFGRVGREVPGGGYIAAGAENYVFAVKTNAAGTVVWENNYQLINGSSFINSQTLKDMIVTPDTGAIFVGTTTSGHGMLFRVRGNGSVNWANHQLGTTTSFNSIVKGLGTDYMIAGTNNGAASVTNIDAAGNILWTKDYAGMNLTIGERIIKMSKGGFIVLCKNGTSDLALMKIDAAGNIIWLKRLGSANNYWAGAVDGWEDSNNGLVIALYHTSTGIMLFKTDEVGNKIDVRDFTGSAVSTITRMSSGAYVYGDGSSLRKFTAFNTIATCVVATNNNPSSTLPIVAPVVPTYTPNTYAVPNNKAYVTTNTTHVITAPCAVPNCNVVAMFNGPIAVCTNKPINFTNTSLGGVTYTWYDNNSQFATTFNATRSFASAGLHDIRLLAVLSGGCFASYTLTVNVGAPPVANAGSNVNLTCGQTTTLNASGGTSYTWSPTAGLSNPYIFNPVASPTTTTAYTVTVVSGGCSNTASVLVTMTGVPTVNATGTTAICWNQSTTLNCTGTASSYTWQPTGQIGTSIVVNPTVTTTYTVSGHNSASCYATSTVQVTVYPLPVVNITNFGNYLQSSPAVTYQWYLNGGLLSGAVNQTYTFTQNGNYTVVVSDANGCTNISANYNVTTTSSASLGASAASLQVMPNPNKGKFMIEAQFDAAEHVEIMLLDVLGKQVRQIENAEVNGAYTKEVDMNGLSSGIYYMTFRSDSGNIVRKIVKND